MKYFKALDLRFSDPKMEAEYTRIKNQYVMRDFIVTLVTIFVVTFTVVVERLIRDDMTEVIISGVTCAVLLVLLVGGRYIRREYLKYITIFAIFCYNMYRVVITESVYSTIVKANLFYGGYTYALFQMILISRIPGNYFKLLVVAGLYVFRFVLFAVWIDSKSLQAGTLIRGAIIDAFILYYFYINDKTERGVFQNFHDSREELKKFKELLDDSLPLSVTVIDNDTGQFLFANKTFSGMFDRDTHRLDPPNMTDPSAVPMITSQSIRPLKPHISFLNVDQATVREMGSLPQTIGSSEFNNNGTVYLKEIMENLTKSDSLHEKVLCFSATYPMPNQRKSYEITLKKIKWNKVEAIAIILSDVTDHENLLALKMANLNKDKILATVSHELRTPLGAIVGLIGMAEQGVKDQKALEYLSLSKDTAELLLTLVNSHLDLQQINAGKLQLNPSKINLRKAMTDISRLFQFQTSKKGILLELVISKDVPKNIVTDENRLKQILINLIGNAIKFTFSGGIKIEICKDFEIPNCLQISVVDTGIGIKDSDKENLFQMYTRLEEGRKINKNGVGLGLMISNALAALLSGKTDGRGIEVTSQQGVGSRFYFRVLEDLGSVIELNKNSHADDRQQLEINELKKEILPEIKCKKEVNKEQDKESFNREMSEDSLPPVDSLMASYTFRINMQDHKQKRLPGSLLPEDYSFEPRSQYKKDRTKDLENNNDTSIQSISKVNSAHHSPPKDHILVVDDNPFNILVTENLLTDLGYLVKSALGGKEAIEIVKAFNNQGKRLKCILMDCLMPEMDGYETSIILKQLMAKGEIETVPIIALTANSNSAEEVKKCLDCGMEGYLTKPIIKANLIKTLSSFR